VRDGPGRGIARLETVAEERQVGTLDAVRAGVRAGRNAALPHHDEAAAIVDRHRGPILSVQGDGVDLELAADGSTVRGVALTVNAVPAGVRATGSEALPYDHEIARRGHRHGRVLLHFRGVGVDLEFAADEIAIGRKTPAMDVELVRTLGSEVLPDDDEIAVAVHRHRRAGLEAREVGVDLEFPADGSPVGGVALAHHLDVEIGAGLGVTAPNHDEIPVLFRRHRGGSLESRRRGVDLKLAAGGGAVRSETLPVDAGAAGVRAGRAIAVPDDDAAAVRPHRHRRGILIARGVGVDLDLDAHRQSVGSESPQLDAGGGRVRAARAEAGPRDHETTFAVHRHRRVDLGVRGVGVDLEFAADRGAVRGVALTLDAEARRVRAARAAAAPDDDEVAVRVHCHRRPALAAGGVGVDLDVFG
jgi:hypothetical protein